MSITLCIPARIASTRLPRKVLLDLGGKPVVQHVWEKAKQRGKALTQQAEYMRNYAYQPLENQTFKMNKHNSNTRNNFNAKKLAQKKAPGGMAVWGGRKGNTRRNRKNRRGTRKN